MSNARRCALSRKPLVPSQQESLDSSAVLDVVLRVPAAEMAVQVQDRSGTKKTLRLPRRVAHLLLQALSQLADGHAVRLLPIRRDLTTHQAAEILNVSRTYLIGLLDKGVVPYRLVGSHRRIGLMDLLTYKEKTDATRHKALAAMAGEAQELKLYE